MKTIQLTKGQFAIVDDDDFLNLSKFNWCAQYVSGTKSYIAKRGAIRNGKRATLLMHREILGAGAGSCVDHINHNTLDNRKENIRVVSYLENNRNKSLFSKNKTGFCGVYWQDNKWFARIRVNKQLITLGVFEDKEDAIDARLLANITYNFHENHGLERKEFGK